METQQNLDMRLNTDWMSFVRKTPEKIAVEDRCRALTYSELYRYVQSISASLPQRLEGKNRLVALFGEKTCETAAAMLGALDAGFGYVGLMPWSEPHLLEENLDACNLDVMITTELTELQKTTLQKIRNRPTYLLDLSGKLNPTDFQGTVFLRREDKPCHRSKGADPEDPAYVLFTSGSTGQSKGVVVSHRAAVTAINMLRRDVPISSDDKIGFEVPLCFDIGTLHFFSALAEGATVHMMNLEPYTGAGALLTYIDQKGIDQVFTVPSTMTYELNHGGQSTSLKKILLSGEPVSEELIKLLKDGCPNAALWNLYGATEFPYALATRIDSAHPQRANTFNLEDNARNSPVRVVNEDGKNVLYVGGAVLFSGYLRKGKITSALTAQGDYRTGDVAQITDGMLYLNGRADRQVKADGIRINLDDVEHALEEDDKISAVAALLNNDGKHIDLYTELMPGTEQDYRPAHFQPMYCYNYTVIDKMPRTASGKKDRKSLKMRGGM